MHSSLSDLIESEVVTRVELLERLPAAQQAVSACLAEVPPTEQLFRDVLETVCRTLGWSFGTAWQREGDALTCSAVWNEAGIPAVDAFGTASLAQRFTRGRGLPGHVWSEGGPVWLGDLRWDPRMASIAAAQRAGLRSAVVVPLGDREDLEGVLEVFCDEVRELEPEVMGWLAATGAQLGQYLARWRQHAILLRVTGLWPPRSTVWSSRMRRAGAFPSCTSTRASSA